MEWALEQQAVDGNFMKKIFFGDEAYITLGGYKNKQNYRVWGFENTPVIDKRSLHLEKVTLWCALWCEGEIG